MTGGTEAWYRVWHMLLIAILAVIASSAPAWAGTAVNTGYFGGVAIEGYDTVAYFTDGRAVKGSESSPTTGSVPPGISPTPSTADLRRSRWYAPQYGGSLRTGACLWSRGRPTSTPKPGRIVDGKLYLFSKGAQAGGSKPGIRSPRPTSGRRRTPGWRRIRRLVAR